MSGNVWEWGQDWYGEYNSSSQVNPTGANSGFGRVLRGGGWSCNDVGCRSSYRCYRSPDIRNDNLGLGLRLVLSE